MRSTLKSRISTNGYESHMEAAPKASFVRTRAYKRVRDSGVDLTMIAAPPGFGKTTLLNALQCDMVASGETVEWRSADNLTTLPREHACADVLLIDDAHQAGGDRLNRFIRTLMAGQRRQRVIIASRTLPDIDWLTMEAAGRAEVLRMDDLTLDPTEAAAMLTRCAQSSPSPRLVHAILRKTEGWPIATQWFGMLAACRGGWPIESTLLECPREDLGRYLGETIMRNVDGEMKDFLLRLSDFPRFSAELLDHVMPADGSRMLESAKLLNLMIVTDSPDGEWNRLHPIFRKYLADKKRRYGIVGDASAMAAASLWCEAHGAPADAIDFAIKAGDHDRAQAILLGHADQLVRASGEAPRLLGWVERLEAAGVDIQIPLRLWKCWSLILLFELDKARAELAALTGTLAPDAPPRWHAHLERMNLSIAARRDDLPAVLDLTHAWLDAWMEREPLHAAGVAVLQSLTHLQMGDRAAARRDLSIARQCVASTQVTCSKIWVSKAEALVELRSGHVTLAKEIIRSGLANVITAPGVAPSAVATVHLLAARIMVEAGDTMDALNHLTTGQVHVNHSGIVETHIAALEAAVLIAEDHHGVDAALIETRQRLVPGLRYALAADLLAVNVQLRNGRMQEAEDSFCAAFMPKGRQWLHVGTNKAIPSPFQSEVEETRAWLSLAQGKAEDALRTARALLPSAEAQGKSAQHVRLLLLAASSSAVDRNDADANRYLARGLRFAAERGLVRTAVDCGWALRGLLARNGEAAGLSGTAYDLRMAIRARQSVTVESGADDSAIERLTNRETEVLKLLDSGLTSQAIADHIDLGLSTTKWHIQNIYNKLGVRNRSGALACARRLALLG